MQSGLRCLHRAGSPWAVSQTKKQGEKMVLIPLTHLLDSILLLVAVGRVELLAELMSLAWLAHKATECPVAAVQT